MNRMRDPVVAFYGGGTDHRGRTLDQILGWSDDQLEAIHDYIQWLFPTVQPSAVNPFAPLVTQDTVAAFLAAPDLRARLLQAFERMMAFYGLRSVADERGRRRVEIDHIAFPVRSRNWLRPGNHNHLRLTRIMESLSTLGLRPEARALQRCLIGDVYEESRNRISRETCEYWRAAVPEQP